MKRVPKPSADDWYSSKIKVKKHLGKRFVVDFYGYSWMVRVRESFCFLRGRDLEFRLFNLHCPVVGKLEPQRYDGDEVGTIWLTDLKNVLTYAENWLKEHCKGSPKAGWRLGGPRPNYRRPR